jgi:hypothetical protein
MLHQENRRTRKKRTWRNIIQVEYTGDYQGFVKNLKKSPWEA